MRWSVLGQASLLALALFLCAAPSDAMQRRSFFCQSITGAPIPACSITVYNAGTLNKATIYSDQAGSSTLGNPFTAGSDGTYAYYAANGRYTEVLTAPGYTFGAAQTQDFILNDPFVAASPAAATGSYLNASAVCSNIPSPIANSSWCLESSTGSLLAYNGSAWTGLIGLGTGPFAIGGTAVAGRFFSVIPEANGAGNVDMQFRNDTPGTAIFFVNSRTANTPGQAVGGYGMARNASGNTVIGIGWQTATAATWDMDLGVANLNGGYDLTLNNKNTSGRLLLSSGNGLFYGVGTGEWGAGPVEMMSVQTTEGRFRLNFPGPHAIGTSPNAGFGLYMSGTIPQGAGAGIGLHMDSTIQPAANADGYGLSINPTLVEASSGTHAVMAGIRAAAFTLTTAGGATTTDAASLYVQGAPSGAASNYAILSAAGVVRLNGNGLLVGGPTGGDKGAGTVNAQTGYYANNNQFVNASGAIINTSVTFNSGLLNTLTANGMMIYCSDCTAAGALDQTCVGGGGGNLAVRVNGVAKCAY